VTHPGRTLTARERGVRRGAPASRPDQANFGLRIADFELKQPR
jgi:lactam utilization protein B